MCYNKSSKGRPERPPRVRTSKEEGNMSTLKRAVSLLAVALLLSAACLPLAGCDGKKDIVIRLGAETESGWVFRHWDFPVGTEEIHTEITYTGKEIRIFVEGYRFHGEAQWFAPQGKNVFYTSSLFTDESGQQSEPRVIPGKGSYIFYCRAASESTLWHARTIRLYITVV